MPLIGINDWESPADALNRDRARLQVSATNEMQAYQDEQRRKEEERHREEQARQMRAFREAATQTMTAHAESQAFRAQATKTMEEYAKGRPAVVPVPINPFGPRPDLAGTNLTAGIRPEAQFPPGLSPEDIAAVQEPAFAKAAQIQAGRGILPVVTKSVLPESVNEAIGSVPYVGTEAERITRGATSPIGLLAAAAAPEATLAGTVGAFGGGLGGQALEQAGVPVVQTPIGNIGPRSVGELVGGFYQGGKQVPAIERPVTENVPFLRNRYLQEHGVAPVAGAATEVSPGIAADTAIAKINAALDQQALHLADTGAVRKLERAQRTATYQQLKQQALDAGASPMDARATARAALGGEYTQGVGTAPLELTEADKVGVWRKLDGLPTFQENRADIALRKLDAGVALQQNEIDLLRGIYGPEFAQKLARPLGAKLGDIAYQVAILPKSLKSAFDLSFLGRQGIIYAAAHPVEWAQSWKGTILSAIKEDNFRAITQEQLDNPEVLGQLVDGTPIVAGHAHDAFGLVRSPEAPAAAVGEIAVASGNWAEHIPGLGPFIRGSNRAYTAAGNILRTKVFDTIVKSWGVNSRFRKLMGLPTIEITEERLQRLANQINRATGRGTFGTGEFAQSFGKVAQAVAWAPQYTVSPAQFAAHAFGTDAIVRQQAWRDIAAFVGAGAAMMSVAKLAGGDVGLDPRSSSFGKISLRGQHFNVFGSGQVLARYATQFVTQQKIPASGGKAYPYNRGQTLLDFARSRFAPVPAVGTDVTFGTTYTHQPVTLKGEAGALTVPLAWQDAYDAFQQEGVVAGVTTGLYSGVGGGVQTFRPTPRQEAFGMSRYAGLSPEQSDQVIEFRKQVEDYYQQLRRAGTEATHADVARALGAATGQDAMGQIAAATYSGDIGPNLERIQYALDHQDELDGETLASIVPSAIAQSEWLSEKNFQKWKDGRAHVTDVPDVPLEAAQAVAGAAESLVR